jgi:SEC-C motif
LAEPTRRQLGRNDPCHCGSGKKYKQCHLAKDEEAERAKRAKVAAQAVEAPADAAAKPAPAPPKHNTRQPWKGQQNTRGFGKLNIPRRSGGS